MTIAEQNEIFWCRHVLFTREPRGHLPPIGVELLASARIRMKRNNFNLFLRICIAFYVRFKFNILDRRVIKERVAHNESAIKRD